MAEWSPQQPHGRGAGRPCLQEGGSRLAQLCPCRHFPGTFPLVFSLLVLTYTIPLGQNITIRQVASLIWQSGALSSKRGFHKSRVPLKSSVVYRLWPGPFWGQRWAGQNAFRLWTRNLEWIGSCWPPVRGHVRWWLQGQNEGQHWPRYSDRLWPASAHWEWRTKSGSVSWPRTFLIVTIWLVQDFTMCRTKLLLGRTLLHVLEILGW